MDARDEHNAIKRLHEGAKQVNRKAKFIEENFRYLEDLIGKIEGKKIIKLVITNFPSFSGFELENSTIIDYNMLESYISNGRFQNKRTTTENGKIIQEETVSEILFYQNEEEFCQNLEGCMQNSPAIENLKKLIEVKMNKISLESMNYDIFVEVADLIA